MNINNGGFRISGGLSNYSVTVCFDNTSYEFFSSPSKTGVTIAYDVDYRTLTAESYVQYYFRPIPVLGIITVGSFVPEVAYAVAAYFLTNGANNAFA